MRLCAHLRWKGLFGRHFASWDALAIEMALNDAAFSCLRTCQSWGPDDDVAAPECCQPDRHCFEPSDQEPRTARLS